MEWVRRVLERVFYHHTQYSLAGRRYRQVRTGWVVFGLVLVVAALEGGMFYILYLIYSS